MAEKSSKVRRVTLVIVALALLVVAVILPWLWWRDMEARDIEASRPGTQRPTETAAEPVGTTEGTQGQTPSGIEPTVPLPKVDQAMRDADKKEMEDVQCDYGVREDEVYRKMPKYEEVRDGMKKLAEERLRGIDPADKKAVLALSQAELEEFWSKGSLLEPEAYDHGYLACAIMEIANERNPDDFELLGGWKEALAAVSPLSPYEDPGIYQESDDRLWPVIDKQCKMVMSGQVPLSPDAMAAVMDWTYISPPMTHDHNAEVVAWQWMVDNTEKGGWSKLKAKLEAKLELEKQGWGCSFTPYVGTAPPGMDVVNSREDRLKYALIWVKYGRRIPSLKGSAEYRKFTIPAWEYSGTVTTIEQKSSSGKPPKGESTE